MNFFTRILASLAMLGLSTSLAMGGEEKQKRVVLNEDNVIYFGSSFTWDSVAKLQAEVAEKDNRLPSHKPLYIIMDSGGGSISAGLELITNLRSYKRKIHTITLFGASMAFQTVQGLGSRYMVATGTLMSHKARGGFSGEFPGQLDSRYNFWLRKLTILDQHTISRTGGKHSLESYRELYENEYWCDGQDCVDQGFADEVINATCDESLSDLKTEERKFFFFGRRIKLSITKSACPLNTGYVDFKVEVDGQDFLKEGDRWLNAKERVAKRLEDQKIWNFVMSKLRKQTMPDRVIYMKVPSRSDEVGGEPAMDGVQ